MISGRLTAFVLTVNSPQTDSGDEAAWEDVSNVGASVTGRSTRTVSPAPSLRSAPGSPGTRRRRPYKTLYVFDVFARAVRLLRIPFSILLVVWILAFAAGKLSDSIRLVLSPLCIIPGVSSSALCSWDDGWDGRSARWADYPKLVDMQSSTFEQLLDESVGGSGLALEIKKAEIATSDLTTLVRISDLNSRDLLADSLSGFVEEAKKTGRGLQKLSAKIGGAVDSVMAVNDQALHTIETAGSKADNSLMKSIWPFSKPQSKKVIAETFTEAMDVLSSSLERVILEAQLQLSNLDKLEQHLTTLHEVVSREDSSLSSAKTELLSNLWTKLGRNRKTLRSFDQHLKLLKNVGGYRKRALAHVVGALQTLEAMNADIEELRERVAAPQLLGEKVSAEVHMRSIKVGLERLKDMRVRAKEKEEEVMRRPLSQ
ncbi:hypothetical protein GLOTRDRAFT_117490 [Gloeophyllum trabeum ATCC 11539]|uniref:Uncharacterized protein n=1 Tax=Gloeophyllum trabeum (strain ATCC 11539 / FP-39264 / Madison 617) TaxID=670483 RepID=S7PZR2_GLOTA|nr:uncharacterized protein GLOTRDRAFT_117490 [Gloeophyllum trabeum ATCC 11539]EPQ52782.1 hypothetical protein GLOTRDRAFT_117490 [Gloeophyllum trabeum ATCC 11539]